MAGDWIKVRTDLFSHPKIVRMASALQSDNLRVVGGLVAAWSLFDAHSVDGRLFGYTRDSLDAFLRWPGFADAMAKVQWLVADGETLEMPDFETHNGSSAKRRAQDADRKRTVRKVSASDADNKRTREEKRREEIETTSEEAGRGSRLPPEWMPNTEWSLQQGLTPARLQGEWDKFRDYWTAKTGKDATKKDWDATWRNWIRKELERNANGRTGNSAVERVQRNNRAAEAREA